MEIKELISHFVIEVLALTSIATFVLLIILAALIRLLQSPPKASDRRAIRSVPPASAGGTIDQPVR